MKDPTKKKFLLQVKYYTESGKSFIIDYFRIGIKAKVASEFFYSTIVRPLVRSKKLIGIKEANLISLDKKVILPLVKDAEYVQSIL